MLYVLDQISLSSTKVRQVAHFLFEDIPNDNEILFTESLLKIVNNGTLVDITIKTKFL